MEHIWPFGGPAHVAIEASLSFCVYYGIKKLHNEGTMQDIGTICRVHCNSRSISEETQD